MTDHICPCGEKIRRKNDDAVYVCSCGLEYELDVSTGAYILITKSNKGV